MPKKSLSRVQEFALINLLKSHCKKNAEGFAEYEEGWSDDKVLEVTGSDCSLAIVRNIRLEFIGNLRVLRSPTNGMIQHLEQRVSELEKTMIAQMLVIDKLLGWAKTRGYDSHILSNGTGAGRPISRPPAP